MINVFIDTQVFVHKNFNYKSEYFQKLIDNTEDGLISIYLTDIVINEIKSKIHEQVYEKVKNSHTKFVSNAKILKNLSEYNNTFDIGERLDYIYNDLINQLEQFLVDVSVKVISTDNISPALIFDMYFKGSPPFSLKKKDEFPDAFSLVALENWFKQKGEKVCVVSDDIDLKNFCEERDTVLYEPSLISFFDSLTKNNSYMHQFITSVYDSNVDRITTSVNEQFDEHGFILMGEDGDIEKVCVQSTEIDEDPYIIDFDSEGATIAFNAIISFNADISYVDYSNSFYDKEEGEYMYLETVNSEVDDVITVPVLMKFKYNYSCKEELEVYSISLNEGESIGINFPNDY